MDMLKEITWYRMKNPLIEYVDNYDYDIPQYKRLMTMTVQNPHVKDVLYSPPATIVWFSDGDKVVSKCDKVDTFSKEVGFMTCLLKKYLGKKAFYNIMDKYVYNKEVSQCTSKR